jgi:hypothetical protein
MDLGAAAFWIATAAVIIMIGWFKTKGDAEKHQTFRTIVEKTGTVDEAQLRMLFDPPNALQRVNALGGPPRGGNYRALRVLGTIVMFVAGGLMLFAGVLLGVMPAGASEAARSGPAPAIAMAMAVFVFVVGAGLFFSARFVEKPRELSGTEPDRE